ncbi:hypothetical protein Bca101_066714 [Brassica carinata]
MTKISDLPIILVEEILSRVSLNNMIAVRSTCKDWDTLSKSRSFSKMHIDKLRAVREGESVMVAMMDYNLYLRKMMLPKLSFSYALGYKDKGSCRSYKFLRFIDQYDDASKGQFSCYEIYDFDSSLWNTLDITPQYWRILCNQIGVSLKGNTYWPASQRNTEDDYLNDHIICFDFTSESFGPLLRLPFDTGDSEYVTLSCVREEKLAVLLTHNEAGPMEFEIWITTKIEAEKVLWSKFLRVEEPDGYPLITCESFFIDEEKKVAMGFEEEYSKTFNIAGEAGYLLKLKLLERLGGDIHCWAKTFSYVPSLVQIKQPAGGKRKHQSYLEKQRFDQSMSRLAALKKRGMVWLYAGGRQKENKRDD